MNQIFRISVYIILLYGAIIECKPKPERLSEYEQTRIDGLKDRPEFHDDILQAGKTRFSFDPKNLPIVGKTTEADLAKMYPEGPDRKYTYLKPMPKTIKKKKFRFDRVYYYQNLITEPIKGKGYSGYRGVDYLDMVIFLLKGKVQYYTIEHSVKGDDDEWHPGIHDMGFFEIGAWPDAKEDINKYWDQRDPEFRKKWGPIGPPPEVPAPTRTYTQEEMDRYMERFKFK